MAMLPIAYNHTIKQERDARLHWFNKESKSKTEQKPTHLPFDKEVEKIIREYLKGSRNA